MLREKEYRDQNCQLTYVETKDRVCITGCSRRSFWAEVPAQLEGRPVTAIDKKAFLSRKNLRELVLPGTVEEIGDWAFAYCSNLERIVLPHTVKTMGKAVFLECDKLRVIECSEVSECDQEQMKEERAGGRWRKDGWNAEIGHLLAAAVTVLDAYYLLDTEAVGSGEWLAKWDARMLVIMEEADMEGYHKQVLCGEEDYGSTDVGAFIRSKGMKKVRLAMLRLLYPEGLSPAHKDYLEDFLVSHTKGCLGEETWLVLLQDYAQDRDRINLFLELGCMNEENINGLLRDMGENHPEMKAMFLRYRDEHMKRQDFFDDLLL